MVCSCQGFSDIPPQGKMWFVINNFFKNYLCGWSMCSDLPSTLWLPPLLAFFSPKKGSDKCFYFNDLSNIYLTAWLLVLQTCGFQGSHKLNTSSLSDTCPCLDLSATFDPDNGSYLLGILPGASAPMYIQFSSALLFFHRLGSPEMESRVQGIYRDQTLWTER